MCFHARISLISNKLKILNGRKALHGCSPIMDDSKPSFLAIVIEVKSMLEAIRRGVAERGHSLSQVYDFSAPEITKALILFCQSYSIMHRHNRLAVISSVTNNSTILFPDMNSRIFDGLNSFLPVYHELATTLANRLKPVLDKEQDNAPPCGHEATSHLSSPAVESGSLSQAMSLALTIINRQQQGCKMQSRILVVQFNRDGSQNYSGMMNTIFR